MIHYTIYSCWLSSNAYLLNFFLFSVLCYYIKLKIIILSFCVFAKVLESILGAFLNCAIFYGLVLYLVVCVDCLFVVWTHLAIVLCYLYGCLLVCVSSIIISMVVLLLYIHILQIFILLFCILGYLLNSINIYDCSIANLYIHYYWLNPISVPNLLKSKSNLILIVYYLLLNIVFIEFWKPQWLLCPFVSHL